MLKAILGLLLSIGIIAGAWALTDALDPLSGPVFNELETCVAARNVPGRENISCYGVFGEQRKAVDGRERLLGVGVGLALACLGWLIAWFVFIGRRRARGADTLG